MYNIIIRGVIGFLLFGILVTSALSAERVALIIGNSGYSNISPLANPKNDAKLMASTLENVGFEVILVSDSNLAGMRKALTEFGRILRKKNAQGLFYYAGHGVQLGGENYIIPVDANIDDQSELSWQAVRVNDVMKVMERDGNNVNIVILDACRNNPFKSASRSNARGLAQMDASKGSYIAYATAPGDVALDGETENSPYTLALASAISTPGLTIEETFKATRQEVLKQTNNRQVPWEASSITGIFHFTAPDQESVASLQDKLKQQQELIEELRKKKLASASQSPRLDERQLASGEECNRLASSALDKFSSGTTPVDYSTLRSQASSAVKACETAVATYPRDDRYKYQLARALMAMGDKDVESAHWMRKAAEGYYPAAMNGLGVYLEQGRGVAKDYQKSFRWIKQAAEKGYVPAMTNLADMYVAEIGVKYDAFKSLSWARKAAEGEDALGMVFLATHYQGRLGSTLADEKEGFKWLTLAATKGEERAFMGLQGYYYGIYGNEIRSNYSDQVKKYTKLAAEKRHRHAMMNMAGDISNKNKKYKLIELAIGTPARHLRLSVENLYVSDVYADSDYLFADFLTTVAKEFRGHNRKFIQAAIKRLAK